MNIHVNYKKSSSQNTNCVCLVIISAIVLHAIYHAGQRLPQLWLGHQLVRNTHRIKWKLFIHDIIDVKFGSQKMKMGRLAPISFTFLIILNIIECKSNEGKFVIKKIPKLSNYMRVSHNMQHFLVFRNSRLNFQEIHQKNQNQNQD